jgi:hypothetical protein
VYGIRWSPHTCESSEVSDTSSKSNPKRIELLYHIPDKLRLHRSTVAAGDAGTRRRPWVHSAPPKVRSCALFYIVATEFLAGEGLIRARFPRPSMGAPCLDWPGLDRRDAFLTDDERTSGSRSLESGRSGSSGDRPLEFSFILLFNLFVIS